MTKEKEYDLIVVGAGPGGCAAAYTAAKAGVKTLMLERAAVPGQKNMSGSVFFMPMLRNVYGDVMDSAPWMDSYPILEGFSVEVIDDDTFYAKADLHLDHNELNDFKFIFRNIADEWIANYVASQENVTLRTSTVAREFVYDDKGIICGVVVDDGEEIHAPLVIAADGVNSLLARRSGLNRTHLISSTETASGPTLCIRYIYKMPEGEGMKRGCVMELSDGKLHEWMCEPAYMGGIGKKHGWVGHVYANPKYDIIDASVYEWIGDMCKDGRNIHQRMQWMLSLPENRKLLEGCELIGYECHMLFFTCQDGYATKTYRDGLMVVGDAAAMMNPFEAFGADAAQLAGKIAGEIAAKAKKSGDYSEKTLKEYEDKWRASFIGKNEDGPRKIAKALWQGEGLFSGGKDLIRGFFINKVNCVAYKDMLKTPVMAKGLTSLPSGLAGFADLLVSPLRGLGKVGKLIGEGLAKNDD